MRKAAFILTFCCVLWGYSFPVMQVEMETLRTQYWRGPGSSAVGVHVQELGLNAAFLGWRFGLAALVTLLGWSAARTKYSRDESKGGALMGALFGAGMICQLAGLRYVLPSVSSFLTSLTVVFTPLAQALIFRRRVTLATWLGVALALGGMTVLAQPNPGACAECNVLPTPAIPYMGEALTTLGALFFTAQLLTLDRFAMRTDPVRLTFAMLAGAGLFTTFFGVLFCGRALYRADVFVPIATNINFVALLLSLVLLCSVAAIHLMNRYQRFVSPAVASVIYSMESVFSTLFSVLFGRENLTTKTALGGALILAALVLVTVPNNEPVAATEAQ